MYKLTIKTGEKVEELEFDSPKLAKLYKDYHLVFGHWKGKSHWKNASSVTKEEMKFVIDEVVEFKGEELIRNYLLMDGVEIIEEQIVGSAFETWQLFREMRNEMLIKSDFTQIPDNSLSQEQRQQWRKYRQYLRDCPILYNDSNIAGKSPSSFEDWKNGKF
jgi:hypothetical protein